MQWFANLSVRYKVVSLAALGFVAFMAYFLYSFASTFHHIGRLEQIEQVNMSLLEQLAHSNRQFATVREAYIRAAGTPDADLPALNRTLLAEYLATLERMARLDPGLREDTSELVAVAGAFGEAAAELFAARQAGQPEQAAQWLQQLREAGRVYEGRQQHFESAQYQRFSERMAGLRDDMRRSQELGLLGFALALVLLSILAWKIGNALLKPINYAVDIAHRMTTSWFDEDIRTDFGAELGRLLRAFRDMRDAVGNTLRSNRANERLKEQVAQLSLAMRGDMKLPELGRQVLGQLVPMLEAQVGALYLHDEDSGTLQLVSSHALLQRRELAHSLRLGETLVGQAALERQVIQLEKVPQDYLTVVSGTGSAAPASVLVVPLLFNDALKGVLEVAAFKSFDEQDRTLLEQCREAIAVAIDSAQNRQRLGTMLRQTREQAQRLEQQKEAMHQANEDLERQAMELAASESRLQQQQEELRAINEELEAQTQALRASEESLQAQQEELRVTNEELEAQARLLAEQKAELSAKNDALQVLQSELEARLRELELSSRYKSEFLSTMSHELRTPLNSILILSNALRENRHGNLNERQVEHCAVIHSAGSDLLALINDILDISKIEEGKMDLLIEPVAPDSVAQHFQRTLAHMAESKGLAFHVQVDPTLPEHFYTDRQRLDQILKNMLSNAMKFTEQGSITLCIDRPRADERLPSSRLHAGEVVRLAVRDTGIGIPADKQQMIFEAFQQADGTTSRRYGGTGLGLTISRELSRLLGGEITIHSDGEGQGATFSLWLPLGQAPEEATPPLPPPAPEEAPILPVMQVREKSVLIIEDDPGFAQVLMELARDYGLEGHVCEDGESGLEYARHHRPSAIMLDIGLPGIDGWAVMEQLKGDPRTRDIPVHVLSGKDARQRALELGAIDFLGKPVSREQVMEAFATIEQAAARHVRRLLVVEDSALQHEGIRTLFERKGVDITAVTTGAEALAALQEQVYDCMILDLNLPDMSGLALLERLHDDQDGPPSLPVIIYTGKDLSREEEARLRRYADRIILKTERSSERLLNEASLFLHWLESTLPRQGRSSAPVEHRDDIFEGRRLLLVDDDMRNIYALSAQLEEQGFDILIASNGREALELLAQHPDLDIVLMDIMMPEMDGYEAMRRIRAQERFARLPILALTAKAMKEDRNLCLEAGANDYCSKPIDMERLTALLRVWLQA